MILLIDNYDSFTYNLYQALAAYHKNIRVVRNDKITIEEIKRLNISGIVLSPGPGRPEDAGICVPLIKEFSTKLPILGVCLGHQAIALAFGGKVVAAPEIIHGKSATIFHNRRGIYQELPLPFKAGRYHSLIVDKPTLPAELMIEAETAEGEIMGMRHVSLPVYGVQFHPESILTPEGETILKNFLLC
jgi:anthranilate synthase component 2